MGFIENLEDEAIIENTKGGRYYSTSYNANLDIFSAISRFQDTDELIQKYKMALAEDEKLALANLLYLLDIRSGKGERYIFKTLYKYLCKNEKELALKILPFISILGRWDYILVGIDTNIEKEVIKIIDKTIKSDKLSDTPTLLAKWLPSHKTHNKRNEMAKKIAKKLGMTEKEYRKTLTAIRKKLNLVENSLTKKQYELIDFETVPTKAMLKYSKAFERNMSYAYREYLNRVNKGQAKINTTGLYSYEIINNILKGLPIDDKLYDAMWENQKDVLNGINENILVMADTSGSMTSYHNIPYATSVGLAIYISQRNTGYFKDHFISFSTDPAFQKVVGRNIKEKVQNMKMVNENTNIDKAFELLLNTAVKNNILQEELPSYIIIVSDMEFDKGVYSENGTNFNGWKTEFSKKGYTLPKIIFWNVAGDTLGVPVTKNTKDVVMVSGFSTAILDNLFTLEKFTPADSMIAKLQKYIDMLEVE